jgi:predicted MFS family arabinose efflux permease
VTRTLAFVWQSPELRLVALVLALTGVINASLFPYLSLVAIDLVGLSDGAFALLLALASVAGVAAALGAGIVTDQRANRRPVAVVTALLTVIGPLAMWLMPGPATLVLCQGLLLPVAGSLLGQSFALARLACEDRPEMVDAVMATLRAMLSLAFLPTLVLWSLAFARGVDVMAIYLVAALAAALLLAATWRDWPKDGRTRWVDRPSGLGLWSSLREIAVPGLMWRVTLLGAITAAPTVYMVVLALIFAGTPGRGPSDTALFVALVGGAEVPFMLLLARITRLAPRSALIAAGAAVYALYLVLLPLLAPSPAVWLLPILAGLGGAAIFALPISYLQDLMVDRPGTGSSLMAVQKVAADLFAAAAFALGTLIGGYAPVALIGAAGALAGAVLIWLADRRPPDLPPRQARGAADAAAGAVRA